MRVRLLYVVYSLVAAIVVQATDISACSLYYSFWFTGQLAVEVRVDDSLPGITSHCT